MQYPHGTLIAVADGKTVRAFRNAGDEFHLRLVEAPEPDIKGHNRGAGHKHGSSRDNPDDRRLDEDSFIAATAEWLNHQALSGEVDKVFVVAPPKALGELRRHYHKELASRLLGELGSEHTSHPVEQIREALLRA